MNIKEALNETRSSAWRRIQREYMEEYCKETGEQKKNNVTPDQG